MFANCTVHDCTLVVDEKERKKARKEKENTGPDKRPAKKDVIELHTKVALSEVCRGS